MKKSKTDYVRLEMETLEIVEIEGSWRALGKEIAEAFSYGTLSAFCLLRDILHNVFEVAIKHRAYPAKNIGGDVLPFLQLGDRR